MRPGVFSRGFCRPGTLFSPFSLLFSSLWWTLWTRPSTTLAFRASVPRFSRGTACRATDAFLVPELRVESSLLRGCASLRPFASTSLGRQGLRNFPGIQSQASKTLRFPGSSFCQVSACKMATNSDVSVLSAEEQRREAKALQKLEELGIGYQLHRHAPVATVDAMVKASFRDKGVIAANLFLKEKQRFFLLTVTHDLPIPLKGIAKLLSAPRMRLADEELLGPMLDVSKGSVTPLAAMCDEKKEVTLVFDSAMKKNPDLVVLVHPLHNKATVALKASDLVKFVEACGHSVMWLDVDEAVKLAAAPAGGANKPNAPAGKAPGAKEAVTDSSMLGVTAKKDENFSEWYTQAIVRSEMIEYYDISGCYIMRPWAFHIWEKVQRFFDDEIKKMGVENSYFPMFVSRHKLEKEKDHVEGFSPEVAWVTHYGDSPLPEKIAIRPTSETIMYPAYAKWIRSHRDLPLKLNQWCSVVRWEFKQPTPFLRTREFLWQEGHTAHATEEEAWELVLDILELYRRWYEECLAVPVIKGEKSEGEKFAGGKKTTTVEAFIPENGRGIQAATSHLLGTNFAKMFEIEFEDEEGHKRLVHQTSWGCTTRSLGVMIMTHGDDKGLVIPPRVASVQVVIIPILFKDENTGEILGKCRELKTMLEKADIRVRIDDRSNYTPGWKYNHWEVKGVPLRLELGPKDLAKGTARVVRRDTGEAYQISWADLAPKLLELMEGIQRSLFEKAKARLHEGIEKISTFDEVMPALNRKHLVLAPWCEDPESEEQIKKETQKLSEIQAIEAGDSEQVMTGAMKTLCIPFDQPPMPEGTKCFYTGKPAKRWTLWGRSY
ncbi:prolyl-tRNA synthetase (ProRS) [Toxoplasma gondii RUB]|uniref:proline--tRNA ligase n=1 Tax=Toxoplasma gondii RUB TaxID=935652 RepID=A0A086M7T0_TOXGO|nr:prolyl-tRNA synthetase (ProRS) [Toxoplasma gondii RUB]